jgi:hypothetical protein
MARFQWLLFVIVIFSDAVLCQQRQAADSTTVMSGVTGHLGSILSHSGQIAHLAGSWLWGVQGELARIRYTQKSWDACNCYSRNGVSLSYFNFTNPEVLGSAISVALFAEPQLTYGRINLSLRGGAGISYLTRVYHPEENPENLFFSDPWSGLLSAQVTARYHVHPTLLLRMEATYNHISNGGKRQPNKGMNFPTLGLGIDYLFKYAPPLLPREKSRLPDKSIQYYAGLFYNTRPVDESNFETEERKSVVGLHGGFYKPLSLMHGLGLAVEAAHDGALKAQAQSAAESFDHHVISALARHHFLFGRFDFSQALGIYLHKEYPTPAAVFQRYALSYLLFGRLQIGFSLKAHLYTAEQMDVRMGVLF